MALSDAPIGACITIALAEDATPNAITLVKRMVRNVMRSSPCGMCDAASPPGAENTRHAGESNGTFAEPAADPVRADTRATRMEGTAGGQGRSRSRIHHRGAADHAEIIAALEMRDG